MTYKEAVKKLRLILLTMLSISLYSCNSLFNWKHMDDHEYCDMIMKNLTSVPNIRTTTLINCVIVVV